VAEAAARGRSAAFGDLRDSLEAIDRARGQNAILGALVTETARFADRAAVLLLRPEGLVGWVARGFEADDAIRSVSVPAQAQDWADLVQAESPTLPLPPPRCAQLVSQLDSPVPQAGVIIPLVLRDRVSAVVYADRTAAVADGGKLETEALQALTYATALALETLGFREREATTTLAPAAGAPEAAAAPVEEAPAAAPQVEAEEDVAAGEVEASELPDVYGGVEGESAGAALEPVELEIEEEETPPAPGTAAAESEVDDGWSTEPSPVEEVEELPVETMEEIEEVELVEESAAEAATDDRLSSVDEMGSVGEMGAIEEETEIELDDAGFEEMPPLDEIPAGPAAAEAALEDSEEIGEYELDLDQAVDQAGDRAGDQSMDDAAAAEGSEAPTQAIPWQTGEAAAPPTSEATPAEGGAAAASDRPSGLPDLPDVDERPEADAVPPPPPEAPEPPEPEGQTAGADATDDAGVEPPAGGPVEPPADVQGPGWAFSEAQASAGEDAGDDAAHDEARRLARLLVSEIQLYNQEEVAEGRRNSDIYERLKDDIDRSRQLYEERVDPGIRESTDYFYQELVRQLGAGDSKALGI
jgi:hypothetical protein